MSKQAKHSLVPTWLRAIHLSEQIIETFEAAGIVNPIDLVDLQPAHYPALGITEPGDRKKLFYLVQRVKMAFHEEEQAAAADDRSLKTVGLSAAALSADDDDFSSSTSSSDGEVPLPPPHPIPSFPARSKSNFQQLHVSTDFLEPSISRKEEDTFPSIANSRSFGDKSSNSSMSVSQRRPSNPQNTTATTTTTLPMMTKSPKPTNSVLPSISATNIVANSTTSTAQQRVSVKPTTSASSAGAINGTQPLVKLDSTKNSKVPSSTTINAATTLVTTIPPARTSVSPTHFDSRQYTSDSRNTLTNVIGSTNSNSMATVGVRSNAPALKTRVVISPGKIRPTPIDTTNVKKVQSSSTATTTITAALNKSSKTSPNKGVTRTTSTVSAPQPSTESQDIIHDLASIPLIKRTSSFPLNNTTLSMDPVSSSSNGIGSGNTPIFIHGIPEDTSFATQIANLRETNRITYEETILNLDPSTHDSSMDDEMRIRVAVRKRPMIPRKDTTPVTGGGGNNNNKLEEVDVIHPLQYLDYGKLLVYQPKTRVDLTKEVETISFAFDNVYDENSTNTQIYNETIRALIPGLFEGRWASVFAYGQTGSGKT